MKKFSAIAGLTILGLGVSAWSSVAFAQSLAPPPAPPPAPAPITAPPRPLPPPPPPVTVATATQQTQPAGGTNGTTVGTNGTTVGTGTTGTTGPNLSGQVNLPILDLGVTQETQGSQQCQPQETDSSICISPAHAREAVLPPVIGGQLKYSLLVFLGAALGGILWILTYFLMGRAQQKRDRLRMGREDRFNAESHRIDNLHKNYDSLCSALSGIFSQKGGKTVFDPNSVTAYKKASTDLDLFGSDATVAANKNLLNTLTSSKNPSFEDFSAAKDKLMASLKKDLGLV